MDLGWRALEAGSQVALVRLWLRVGVKQSTGDSRNPCLVKILGQG